MPAGQLCSTSSRCQEAHESKGGSAYNQKNLCSEAIHTIHARLSAAPALQKVITACLESKCLHACVQARMLLSKVGGIVHHVHMEAGGRVSYKPYRDVSKVFISRLRQFAGVGVIEKASIDEAYISYKLEPHAVGHSTMPVMQQAEQLAQTIRLAGNYM